MSAQASRPIPPAVNSVVNAVNDIPKVFDRHFAAHAGIALPVGLAAGGIAALLMRKIEMSRMKNLGFQAPERRVTMPLAPEQKPPEPKVTKPKTKPATKEAALGHWVGGVGGAGVGYKLFGKLFAMRHSKMLDEELAKRDKMLNSLLIHEQALSSGLEPEAAGIVAKTANCRRLDVALRKFASAMYDVMEKRADVSIAQLLADALNFMAVGHRPFGQALMAGSGVGGLMFGYHAGSKSDPSRAMAKAVQDSLKERLTGKDQLVGPMPIRVETDRPGMSPLRPGASSLIDPSKGRDVLEGI